MVSPAAVTPRIGSEAHTSRHAGLHALPCKYLPRTQVHSPSSPVSHPTSFSSSLSFITMPYYHSFIPRFTFILTDQNSPRPIHPRRKQVHMRDDQRYDQPTYTHDRPFSKREIGLTPHSPSGSWPTQKGNSRPLGTWILDKLRPLAPMPMSQCIATAA